ncbi:alpha/beta hydrolase-fold protein [uncultured Aquimarina sp.]|uniref:alpha/beta hydrolase n=1 Tax=uncultured Aquimarina sp. TaxID=575652 RepID=UPI0026116271|nr:alpha/beta hydrolase-fold protein [uncultured Aquimarina sp.]
MKPIFLHIICLFVYSLTFCQEQVITINSKHLSKKIKVITYNTDTKTNIKQLVYITDGKKFIDHGGLEKIKTLTKKGKIPPAQYVFISTIDPESKKDLRNYFFFNNPKYLDFFESELIPRIETSLTSTLFEPKDRSLIGISFGGLNAAYFSAKSKKFKNFALLSPITYPKKEELIKAITFSENKNLKIFLSTGTNDAENYVKDLKAIYLSKGYKIKTLQTEGSHDFKNWNGQLTEIINCLLSIN